MQWEFVVALLIAIPVVLFPVAFVWYLNLGGIYAAIKEARQKRVAREERTETVAEARQRIGEVLKEQPIK